MKKITVTSEPSDYNISIRRKITVTKTGRSQKVTVDVLGDWKEYVQEEHL